MEATARLAIPISQVAAVAELFWSDSRGRQAAASPSCVLKAADKSMELRYEEVTRSSFLKTRKNELRYCSDKRNRR